jgi:hypothetical protein
LHVSTAAQDLRLGVAPQAQTHKKGTADNDQDAARLVAGLCVHSRDLVLDALEGKLLYSRNCISLLCSTSCHDVPSLLFAILVGIFLVVLSYLELADDVGGTEEGRLLKGEHGVLTLYTVVSFLCLVPLLE